MRKSQEMTHLGVDAKGLLCQVFFDIRSLLAWVTVFSQGFGSVTHGCSGTQMYSVKPKFMWVIAGTPEFLPTFTALTSRE